jgi:hypothetical protein
MEYSINLQSALMIGVLSTEMLNCLSVSFYTILKKIIFIVVGDLCG